MILVDTNVLSELWKPVPNPVLLEWFDFQHREAVFASAITLAELHFGIAKLDEERNKKRMQEAVGRIERETFGGRVLSFDNRTVRQFGDVRATRERAGRPISFADAAIASIAMTYGLVLATRKTKEFDGTGLELINPFEPQA